MEKGFGTVLDFVPALKASSALTSSSLYVQRNTTDSLLTCSKNK